MKEEDNMLHAIRQKVTVQAGGRIEICAPELAEGTQAEVIVIEEPAPQASQRLTELIGQGRGAKRAARQQPIYLDANVRIYALEGYAAYAMPRQ